MDVLSDILDGLEMQGSLYFSTEFAAPWSILVPAEAGICRFHVMVHGPCRITVPETGDVRELTRGDLALVPRGRAHWLQSAEGEPLTPLPEVLEEGRLSEDGCLHWGGGGAVTRMVCGYFAFDQDTVRPVLSTLPALVHVQATRGYELGWIEDMMRFIGQEAGSGQPGSEAISRRLSEILLIQVIRHHAAHAGDTVPVLSAIVHPNLGRALRAMHADPAAAWTVETLAREAAMSRTAFSQAFGEHVGEPPIRYLTRLRMQRARKLLRTDAAVAEVGEAVGYRSPAAFNRAFKREVGVGPGAYRRRRAT